MEKNNQNNGYTMCTTCTIILVKTAYGRAPWFKIVREPLRCGMVIMGQLYGINPDNYLVKSAGCRDCVRFIKTGLKEKSSLFRMLNRFINPVFDHILETIVTRGEVLEAKRYAREATHV